MPRTFAVGDVHGCDTALETLLLSLDLHSDDTLIQLGDLCDRGPNTARVINLLIALGEEIDLQVVLGNHDEMFLGALGRDGFQDAGRSWLAFGGKETLASYGGAENVPTEHVEFLEAAQPILQRGTDIFVHALIDVSVPLDEQKPETLRWDKLTYDEPPPDGKRVVCGHTAQPHGTPRVWPGWCCIDTKVYGKQGWLTALEIRPGEPDRIWQANERGERRGPVDLAGFADDG
ncbi:MAG: metallophosphoesterase [Planctomycetota bacterium]